MFHVDKLVNFALNHSSRLLLFATIILKVATGGDIPPDDVGS